MSWINPLTYTPEQKAISDAQIRKNKTIRHLLTPAQRKMWAFVFETVFTEMGYYCSRKVGKTASLLLICFEFAMKTPYSLTRFILADQTQATNIIEPMFHSFIKKLIPSDMLPIYLKSERAFRFSNGATIKLNGANPDVIEKARGPSCNLMVFDEIAIWDGDVRYALLQVFFPQGSLTDAKKIYSCTPPPTIDSYYIQNIHPKLISNNTIIEINIYQNPLLNQNQIERIIEEMGGVDSPEFKREYLCELIPNNNLLVTPEFNIKTHVFDERPKFIEFGDQRFPQSYQYYSSIDSGTVDNNAILIGYLDHHSNQLIVEDEDVQSGLNLTNIAEIYKELEKQYKEYFWDQERGNKLVLDAFELEKKELREVHKLSFMNPFKGKNVEDNISYLRSALSTERILIKSKCKRLIWELKNCIWDDNESTLKRIKRNKEQKHGDTLMALVYMVRSVNWHFRPFQKSNFKFNHEVKKNLSDILPSRSLYGK